MDGLNMDNVNPIFLPVLGLMRGQAQALGEVGELKRALRAARDALIAAKIEIQMLAKPETLPPDHVTRLAYEKICAALKLAE